MQNVNVYIKDNVSIKTLFSVIILWYLKKLWKSKKLLITCQINGLSNVISFGFLHVTSIKNSQIERLNKADKIAVELKLS